MVWMAKIRRIFLLLFSGLLSFSCQENRPPSFIIIAADQLSFESFYCSDERFTAAASGLNILCTESIRFSNAHTTSIHSAAAMGSLLTGKYPYQHRLHRSFDRLDPEVPVLAEMFRKQGYRTAFWSAKPTLLRKTGLARGFDLFDDTGFLSLSTFSMSFNQQAEQFKNWVGESREPFLAVIYNSDLQLLNEGEAQISNLEKFDESLGRFFQKLKDLNLWEKNYIAVAGLQGKSDYSRINESYLSNLHSENTNISLFIKPPRQKGDEGVNWKIDSTLTLADFGLSLIKTISPSFASEDEAFFPVRDYSGLWSQHEVDAIPNSPRYVLIESANTWKPQLELRFAIHYKNSLFIDGAQPEYYNRLTDGLETINLKRTESEFSEGHTQPLSEIRRSIGAEKWTRFRPAEYRWVTENQAYWSKPNSRAAVFEKEKQRIQKEKTTQPLSTLLIFFQNPKVEKNALYEEARRNSYNLSLENIWGIWDAKRQWPQPGDKTVNQ